MYKKYTVGYRLIQLVSGVHTKNLHSRINHVVKKPDSISCKSVGSRGNVQSNSSPTPAESSVLWDGGAFSSVAWPKTNGSTSAFGVSPAKLEGAGCESTCCCGARCMKSSADTSGDVAFGGQAGC